MRSVTAAAGTPDGLTRLARAGTVNLAGAIVTGVCTFGLTVVIARGVSRAEAGAFFSATSLFLVATAVGQLGTQTALVYFVARCRAAGQSAHMDAYLRIAIRPVVAIAAAMAVAVFVFARPLAELTLPDHADSATTYFRVMAPFIPAAGVEYVLLAGTRGLGYMRATALIEQIGRPAAQLTLVAAATLAATSAALGLAWSATYLPAALAAWLAWRALRSRQPVADLTDDPPPTPRKFWNFAMPRALTSVLQMLMQRFDIVLVGAIAGAADAAIYAAATRFIVLGQLAMNAFTTASQPQLAAHLSTGDRERTNAVYQTSTAWLMLVTWPLYLTMIVFAKPLLLVFGHGYSAGQAAILLIACSMLVATGFGVVDTVLSMAGRTSWNLGNAALAFAINIGLDLLLIPRHGIVGAAIGWAAAIVVRNVAAVLQVSLRLGPHPFAQPALVAAVLTSACYFALLVAVRSLLGATPFALAVGLVVATAVYLPSLWLARHSLRLDALVGLRHARSGG
jgi:O-antigen/teichoic acid export membrane protein